MTELELQQYLLREYPQENARCEWKEFKNLKNSCCRDEKDAEILAYGSSCKMTHTPFFSALAVRQFIDSRSRGRLRGAAPPLRGARRGCTPPCAATRGRARRVGGQRRATSKPL